MDIKPDTLTIVTTSAVAFREAEALTGRPARYVEIFGLIGWYLESLKAEPLPPERGATHEFTICFRRIHGGLPELLPLPSIVEPVCVVKLTALGVGRVNDGAVGMTFIVDKFTDGVRGKVAHVRDYRFTRNDLGRPFQTWSISAEGYEVV